MRRKTINTTYNDVLQWAIDRNLIDGSNSQAQMLKLAEEFGELAGNIAKGRPIKDDIGDMMVVLTIIAAQNSLTLAECYQHAYRDIKDRKGKMVQGVFVKEG